MLSLIELKLLKVLSEEEVSLEQASKNAMISFDASLRAASWLSDKNLAILKSDVKRFFVLTMLGKKALKEGLIEKQLLLVLNKLKGKSELHKLKTKSGLENKFSIAFGFAKKKAWVGISREKEKTIVSSTKLFKEPLLEESLLKRISKEKITKETLNEEEKKVLKELIERKLIELNEVKSYFIKATLLGLKKAKTSKIKEDEIVVLNSEILKNKTWKTKSFRSFNIQEPTNCLVLGREHPYARFLSQVKKKLIEFGFEEMSPRLIELEFYNFDALFQPQNHPARTWTDTYHLKKPVNGVLPKKEIVNRVKAVHETGGNTSSRGWNYSWDAGIARRLMPLAHGTGQSIKELINGIKIPGKYFALSRVFRPDVVDRTHLSEFNQLEGFVAAEDINFKHLLGLLKEFAIEIAGATKVRFLPDYYPFTEPSVQLNAFVKELNTWVEFAGAGMFRPEVLKPFNIDVPVIAWGIGLDRLAMSCLAISDVRELFSKDLGWLRQSKQVIL